MTTGKALNGKPYAGNPHVRFDEGAGAPRHSGRSALLYMHQMTRLPNLALTREGLSQAVVGLTAVLSIMAAGGAAPKTATIIPAPREMRVTGGEYVAEKPPTLEKVDGIPREGYEISITTNGITIRHSDDAGAYYANMTLFHSGRWDAKAKCKAYPCLEIRDWPQFEWRGVHLDDARHFFGKDTVMRLLEQMSWFKFNVFHWHLTDTESWTLEIPGYPELVKRGGVWGGRNVRELHPMGEKVGPFHYTANDVREILAYAKARHIKVVPEIDFPGHFLCAGCAYPELCCNPAEIHKAGRQPVKSLELSSVMCVGNPKAIKFMEDVLDYVCGLFPGDVVHIGGDECSRKSWTTCPKCQALIKKEGLKGVEELQPWLTRHFVEYLAKKGKRTIGWDEIFMSSSWTKWGDFMKAGGDSFSSLLPKTTMGMCWRTWGAGPRAANKGYGIVQCPMSHCYFDYGQGLSEDPYFYIGGKLPLERVYTFDPFAGVDAGARKNVMGGQCCNWASHTSCRFDLEWKLWPRGFALAEVLWTYPDPAKRDFKEFSVRAAEYRRRLVAAHVNCAPLK